MPQARGLDLIPGGVAGQETWTYTRQAFLLEGVRHEFSVAGPSELVGGEWLFLGSLQRRMRLVRPVIPSPVSPLYVAEVWV
jgi:hypothetical protein